MFTLSCIVLLLIGSVIAQDAMEARLQRVEKMVADLSSKLDWPISSKMPDGNNGAGEFERMKNDNTPQQMNETELEERVALLELQMNSVISDVAIVTEDVTTLDAEVNDLEEDVEAQLTLLQSDISFIQSGQLTQDERIQALEGSMESVAGNLVMVDEAISELNTILQSLNATVSEVMQIVEDLDGALVTLESRLDALELNGTFAFHALFTSYDSIPENTIVPFPIVTVNVGNSFDGATGLFMVPPGGGGLYYFYTYYLIQSGESAGFGVNRNEEMLCFAEGNGEDASAISCGAVVNLSEGTDPSPFFFHIFLVDTCICPILGSLTASNNSPE